MRAAEAAAAESEAASAEAERRAAAAAAMATAHEDVASSQAHISEQVRCGLQHLGGLGKALRVAVLCAEELAHTSPPMSGLLSRPYLWPVPAMDLSHAPCALTEGLACCVVR